MEILDYLKYSYKPPVPWIEKEKDTEYAFWTEGDVAYVSFQGSRSITDWIYNFMAWSFLGVHAGIWKKYKIISESLNTFIWKNLDKKFIFLGHSQGAGIALVAFIERAQILNLSMEAHLFGCPKIFNIFKYFSVRKFCGNVNQYAIQTDIITKIAPWNFQVGKIIKLGMSLPIWKWKVGDHYPSSYKKCIKELEV